MRRVRVKTPRTIINSRRPTTRTIAAPIVQLIVLPDFRLSEARANPTKNSKSTKENTTPKHDANG